MLSRVQFKEVSKVGMGLENSLYRNSGSLGSSFPPGLSSHIVASASTPFAPPSHPASMQQKVSCASLLGHEMQCHISCDVRVNNVSK